ncbi:MAG: chemotaxis response regulator protein-glutamate methylesterase [Rhodospirillales bacterium]
MQFPQESGQKIADPIRVMIVDDSAVVRGLEARMLNPDPAIEIVASVVNGDVAVKTLPRHDIDVIVLDIEMPVMDGLTALPKLLAIKPSVQIIMASTLTQRNAEVSIKAMAAGAADYIPKPSTSGLAGADEFRRELLSKIKALGQAVGRGQGGGTAIPRTTATGTAAAPLAPPAAARPEQFTLRDPGTGRPEILAIGSSTGGPQALLAFLKSLDTELQLPILITQHMPPTFTSIFAAHIAKQSPWTCSEGKDGDPLKANHVYVAPGDYHMTVVRKGAQRVIALNQEAKENFCRPAVDPMFRSLATSFGGNVLAVILTGMGADGCKGGEYIVRTGGTVIAQDKASSVVWGMPGAAAMAGICSAVLPLNELPSYVNRFVESRRK